MKEFRNLFFLIRGVVFITIFTSLAYFIRSQFVIDVGSEEDKVHAICKGNDIISLSYTGIDLIAKVDNALEEAYRDDIHPIRAIQCFPNVHIVRPKDVRIYEITTNIYRLAHVRHRLNTDHASTIKLSEHEEMHLSKKCWCGRHRSIKLDPPKKEVSYVCSIYCSHCGHHVSLTLSRDTIEKLRFKNK